MSGNSKFTTVKTKSNENPEFSIKDEFNLPCLIRRSALNKAVGLVNSYISNLKNWHRESEEFRKDKPQFPTVDIIGPTFYSTRHTEVNLKNVKGILR